MNKGALRDLKSVYLIVGTAIGTGILALPIATAKSGFLLSSFGLVICWFFMTLAAFYMMEARLYFSRECDLDYMSEQAVGPKFEFLTKIAYLMLLFSLMAAYISVGSSWLNLLCETYFQFSPHKIITMVIFTSFSAALITQGIRLVGKANHIVTVILLISFACVVLLSLNHVKGDHLMPNGSILEMIPSIPLILTTFGFSIVIPSIASYLDHDPKRISESIMIGSVIILFSYLLWQLIAFGVIGQAGDPGLLSFIHSQDQSTDIILALSQLVKNAYITLAARAFIIFAVISSLLGVGLSLYHFMMDAVKVKEHAFRATVSTIFTFIPPLGLLIFYPAGIIQILNFAGIFVAIILGIIPCILVWFGRYVKQFDRTYECFGGRPLILLTFSFFIYVIIQEIQNLWS